MPPEREYQYDCDHETIDQLYEGCENYQRFENEEYHPDEDDDLAERLDNFLDEINDGKPAQEPAPEPEPEEQFELTLGEVRIDGEKFSQNSPTSRETVEKALQYCVDRFERTSKPVELEIFVDKVVERNGKTKNLCRKISVDVNRPMDMDEAFFPEDLAEDDWVRTWLEENDIPGDRFEEPDRAEGMSWVHIEVRNSGKTVGRVSACVLPGETSRHIAVSFAFCRGTLPFSKRQGRILSRKRMSEGRYISVIAGESRYDTVQEILRRSLHGQKHTNSNHDSATEHFPQWLYPEYREDIPEDVEKLLEKIYTDVNTRADIREEIGPMLSRNIRQRADVELAKIKPENNLTFQVRELY